MAYNKRSSFFPTKIRVKFPRPLSAAMVDKTTLTVKSYTKMERAKTKKQTSRRSRMARSSFLKQLERDLKRKRQKKNLTGEISAVKQNCVEQRHETCLYALRQLRSSCWGSVAADRAKGRANPYGKYFAT